MLLPTRGDRPRATLEATPELRRAFVAHPEKLVKLSAATDLAPTQLSTIMRGKPFTEVLRPRVVALGALIGVAAENCVRTVKR